MEFSDYFSFLRDILMSSLVTGLRCNILNITPLQYCGSDCKSGPGLRIIFHSPIYESGDRRN